MKIAFISYEFPPDTGKGGIGTYVKQIAAAMADCNMVVHVFAGSNQRTYTEKMDGYQVHWIMCNNGNDFKTKVVNSFQALHNIAPFDLMESPEIGGNAWEIKKKFPYVPLVVRLHAPDYLVESLKKKYVPFFAKLRFVLGAFRRLKWDMGYWRKYKKESDADYQFIQLANYITAPSEAMKDWAVKNWKIAPEKISVIPNIFLPPTALLQIPICVDQQYKRVVFFGRLNALKGLVNASKAMKKILQEYPEWKWRVIGDDGNGPYAGISMRNWMKEYLKPVIQQVQFLDGMDYEKLPWSITEAEIILLPSLFESFSYTCVEAMAAGKAVVGSKFSGMADMIMDGENGLLIDAANKMDIYSAIQLLIQDDKARYRMSVQARESIQNKYSAGKLTYRLMEFYNHAEVQHA
jgi:glycogen synthase